MLETLKIYFKDILTILSNPSKNIWQKFRLIFNYKKITWMRFLDGRILKFKSVKIFGFRVNFVTFSDFFWTFRELFIHEDYYFKADKVNPIIFDCGGNIGLAVIYFKYLYPQSIIHTFEPHPENLEVLNKNVKDNNLKDVFVHEVALGKEKGELELYGSRRAATLKKDFSADQGVDLSKTFKVYVEPITDYLKGLEEGVKIDLLKIDIEGAEYEVLESIEKANTSENLFKKIGQIILELHLFEETKNGLAVVSEQLISQDYDIIVYSDRFSQYCFPTKDYYHIMLGAKNKF